MWLNMQALLYDRLKHPKRRQPRPVNIRLNNVFFESLLITDVEWVLASADLVEGDAEGPDVGGAGIPRPRDNLRSPVHQRLRDRLLYQYLAEQLLCVPGSV